MRRRTTPVRAAAAPTVAVRARHDGWTPTRQAAFLEALAAGGCVTEACAAVGLSSQSAYRLRMRPDAQGFRLAWDAALDLGIRRLTDACLSRALHGEPVPHYYQGEQVGEHRRYDNRLAMFLLRYRDPLRYAATLDQMVYSGHPETAAIAFVQAQHHAADEAWGSAAGPPPPTEPPFACRSLKRAVADAVEEAAVADTGPVGGSTERRTRIHRQRQARWAAAHAAGQTPEAIAAREGEAFIASLCAAADAAPPVDAGAGGDGVGGDVASPLSPSVPGDAAHRPPDRWNR